MKWKSEHIGRGVFLSVDPVYAPNSLVVDADDSQVELLDPQNLPQHLHPAAQRRPADGDGALQVSKHQAHQHGRGPRGASAQAPAAAVREKAGQCSEATRNSGKTHTRAQSGRFIRCNSPRRSQKFPFHRKEDVKMKASETKRRPTVARPSVNDDGPWNFGWRRGKGRRQ